MKVRINSILLALAMFLFIAPSFGQKLKDKRVKFKYVHLPAKQLPSDYQTYSVNIYGSSYSVGNYLSKNNVAKKVYMDGFKRLNGVGQDYGHLRVRVSTGYPYVSYGELDKKTKTKKDKEGKEKTTTTYWYNFETRASAFYRIYDPKGNIVSTGETSINENKKSKTFTTYAKAKSARSAEKLKIRKSLAKSITDDIVKDANNSLAMFDFREETEFEELYFLKKHDDAKMFEKYVDEAQEIFKNSEATTSSEELRKKVTPMLAFWKTYSEDDPGKDKGANRVYVCANYNIALISFFIDDFETSKKHAANVMKVENDKHPKTKKLLKHIAKHEELMELNNINTLHYVRNLDKATAPAKVKELEEIKEEIAEDNESISGTVTLNAVVVTGNFHQKKEATEMTFGEEGNTMFTFEENNELKEVNLNAQDVSEFTLGERHFKKMPFSPCAKGKEDAKMHILEVLYTSEKITLFKYYPTTGELNDAKSEFAFKKTSDALPTSLLDTQFLIWKKGIAKYFEDCIDLNEMCTAGEIKMVNDDLLKAARIYSELCE